MALLVPNEGEVAALTQLLTSENQTLELYATNVTPAETDTVASYTAAAGGGYAAKTLTGTESASTWTITGGAPTSASYGSADQEFVFTGPLTTNPDIYGYLVKGATSGDLFWAEKFASTFTPTNNGDKVTMTPAITAD